LESTKASRKLSTLTFARKGGITLLKAIQLSQTNAFPIQTSEGEYRRLTSEIEKYRRFAAHVAAPIFVQRDRYNEIIGWTEVIVSAEIEARDARIKELEQHIAAYEGSDSVLVVSQPAAARAA
jgi:hypothetical protein